MIPDRRWFPSSLQERAPWYGNFNTHIQILGAGLGLSVAELGHIADDNDMIQFLATTAVSADAYQEAIRQFRKVITEGDIGDPNPAFPANLALTPPGGGTSGIFERLDDFVKRIRVAPTYTNETGALLGIIPNGGGGPNIPIGNIAPVLKPSVDPGHVIEVKFTRGDSAGIYLEKNVNNAGWTFIDKIAKSPGVFTVPGDGIPQGVQLRARFLAGNEVVGDWSDIVTVQTIP